MNRLSHSQLNRFSQCGISYKHYYKSRIRPNVQSAALLFGSALDNALNELLVPKGKSTPEDIFYNTFLNAKINDVDTYIPTATNIVYANADFDEELLTEEDFVTIKTAIELGTIKSESDDYIVQLSTIKKKKEAIGFELLSRDEKTFYNYMNWLSLVRKGFLMLNAYREKVIPVIEKVHTVQKMVKMNNHDGDEIIGYVDLVADVKGYGTVILDNKTSAMAYEEDAALTSAQLALYMHILHDTYKTRKVGYIVLRKNVKKNRIKICSTCGHDGTGARHKSCNNEIDGKRCGSEWKETIKPEIEVQIIISEISETVENLVLDNFDTINYAIKQEIYPRNLQTCTNYYGGKCPYYQLCYFGSKTGLIELKERE